VTFLWHYWLKTVTSRHQSGFEWQLNWTLCFHIQCILQCTMYNVYDTIYAWYMCNTHCVFHKTHIWPMFSPAVQMKFKWKLYAWEISCCLLEKSIDIDWNIATLSITSCRWYCWCTCHKNVNAVTFSYVSYWYWCW